MLHELFTTIIKSFSRTIGRILAYISIALVIFLIYEIVNALEIDSNNMPIDSNYVELFGRILESKPIVIREYVIHYSLVILKKIKLLLLKL